MSIKTRMMVENPDDVLVTIKTTMTIREWSDIRDKLSKDSNWSAVNFSRHVSSVVEQICRVVYADQEESET